MAAPSTFLVLGASGGTGKHFLAKALAEGHTVKAFVRTPSKLGTPPATGKLDITQGSITDTETDLTALTKNVDYVVVMLGDKEAQRSRQIVTDFMKRLVPAMRQNGVKRMLYQAGGFTRPYNGSLSPLLWILRYTLARGFEGQHQDNEATLKYLNEEAMDLEWMVHRAGIGGDGPSKGTLQRSQASPSIGNHIDCADFNFRTVMDKDAVHQTFFSAYQ